MKFISTCAFFLLVLFSSQSYANCSSVITGRQLIWKSDIIFEGTVIQAGAVSGTFDHSLTFQVNYLYKADDGKKTIIKIYDHDPESEDWSSKIGEKYLVFSWLDKQGKYGTYMCAMNYLNLEKLKDKQISNNILDTLELLHSSYPAFQNPRALKWLEERRSRRSFIENLLGMDF